MSLEHNNKIINELDADDFVYLEKDLDFYEKVIETSNSYSSARYTILLFVGFFFF